MSAPRLVKNTGDHRYELWLDETLVSLADYLENAGVVAIPHTETRPDFGGRGYAGRLVRFALDDIRAQRCQVEPACPFVADYLRAHPEYLDLVASDR